MSSTFIAPKSVRLQIGVFGRRNVGKSSTLNALTRQDFAIVSSVPGTTTDPIEKAMELAPLGPVLLIDSAGVDDEGTLGAERVARTRRVFDRVDVGLIVVDSTLGADAWGAFEEEIADELARRAVASLVVWNKVDASAPASEAVEAVRKRSLPSVEISALGDADGKSGSPKIREALTRLAPEEFFAAPPLVADLIPKGEFAVLVAPIDAAAPKGRLILPQVQTIRDLLDGESGCVVVRPELLSAALDRFKSPPALVVVDSQAFKTVAEIVPRSIPLTSFSILFARRQADLRTAVDGARRIAELSPDSRVLIAEACSHHATDDDIGTAKLPRWLRVRVGATLRIERAQGRDFPTVDELRRFDLIIHCGACSLNRREMLARLGRAAEAGVPTTNYGTAIAFLNGILERAVEPFGL
ncbi:MAG: [Thermoguttaceae bacterium]|nr:[FeFe] hydrogenase H-cluster maturation GTPase HydF [Thermoguttaceae bacterium]